jgi:hypothetical protein
MADVSREQFVQTVIDAVKAKFPLVKLARADQPFSLRLNGRVASLESLYRDVQLNPEDATHRVERWAVELLRASEGTPDAFGTYEELKGRIMPLVISRDSEEVAAAGLVTQPLVGPLRVAYVLDGDRTISYLSQAALSRWNVSVDDLHELAIENLVQRSESMNAHAAAGDDGQVYLILFKTNDGFDASRLLLPTLHDRLREYLGSPFLAAVPNRDILLCFRDDQQTLPKLQAQIQTDFKTQPHQVTDQIFLVTADGIAPSLPEE